MTETKADYGHVTFKINHGDILFFDIETAANPDALALMPDPKPPANLKDPEKIKAAIAEKKAEQVAQAALDPDYGQIVAIAYQVGFCGEPQVVKIGSGNNLTPNTYEIDIVAAFWENFAKVFGRCCGYNILNFDLPYLLRRSMAFGIKPSIVPTLAKYRIDPVFDLYQILYNWQPGKGLKTVAKLYGIPVPAGDLDGSQVAAMDAETLKGYVLSDLQVTVKLFKKMNSVYFNLNL